MFVLASRSELTLEYLIGKLTDAAQVVLRSLYVMETQLRPVLSRRNKDKANLILNTMWIMVGTGLGVFLMGFLIWNIDNAFCSQIRQWRRQLGLPWGALLEGHAWWHLMTGVGGMGQRTGGTPIFDVR
ncbi:alkaline phytoceramidase [Colletotrichum salicis]|uniref:Alkaline phytoceramidase n=1 Tax=Colletotrichum salicis TaxID=1209931 RepID=A0A135UQI8_9PEZI|nr:alkaline phytoceramidase [Colletotrichum salicis]